MGIPFRDGQRPAFRHRTEAGQHLAKGLQSYANRSDVLVVGLPRGGIPVAFEVARALHAPLDICKSQHPRELIVAIPVAPREVCQMLADEVDRVVCLATPSPFYAIALWYENFSQTSDAEVCDLLAPQSQNISLVPSPA